jgi:uncharacterized protein YggU (UPF0235/DUF167 family)
MKFTVRAKPNASYAAVKQLGDNVFEVAVREPPIQGRANQAIVAALADYLNVAPSRVRIVMGYTSRENVLEVI